MEISWFPIKKILQHTYLTFLISQNAKKKHFIWNCICEKRKSLAANIHCKLPKILSKQIFVMQIEYGGISYPNMKYHLEVKGNLWDAAWKNWWQVNIQCSLKVNSLKKNLQVTYIHFLSFQNCGAKKVLNSTKTPANLNNFLNFSSFITAVFNSELPKTITVTA